MSSVGGIWDRKPAHPGHIIWTSIEHRQCVGQDLRGCWDDQPQRVERVDKCVCLKTGSALLTTGSGTEAQQEGVTCHQKSPSPARGFRGRSKGRKEARCGQ